MNESKSTVNKAKAKPNKIDLHPDKIKKQKELIAYLGKLKTAPEQRSKEWYAIKQTTIGGSEIATILEMNPFRSLKMLIAEKVGIGGFEGNIATRWGTMFEHITKKWTELILKLDEDIQEAGSIEGVIQRQRYSPDGLSVVKLKCADGTYDYFIVLFEFKAPFSSLPNGKIPHHYMPQVQTGLLNIPLTDIGIFINNCYRICPLEQLDFESDYNEEFHAGDFKKRKSGMKKYTPLACGLICFYQTKEEFDKLYDYMGYSSDSDADNDIKIDIDIDNDLDFKKTASYFKDVDIDLLYNSHDDPIDFGGITSSNKDMFERLLELYDNKRVRVMYYPIIPNNEEISNLPFVELHGLERDLYQPSSKKLSAMHLQKFLSLCEEKDWISIGYLPWKLFCSDIIAIDKDLEWQEKIEDKVNEAVKILDEINNSKDPIATYYKKYPAFEHASDDYLNEISESMDGMMTKETEKYEEPNVDDE
jgi:hypothetical protein